MRTHDKYIVATLVFLLLSATIVQAQYPARCSGPCGRYYSYARGAGAAGTLGPLMAMQRQCQACIRGRVPSRRRLGCAAGRVKKNGYCIPKRASQCPVTRTQFCKSPFVCAVDLGGKERCFTTAALAKLKSKFNKIKRKNRLTERNKRETKREQEFRKQHGMSYREWLRNKRQGSLTAFTPKMKNYLKPYALMAGDSYSSNRNLAKQYGYRRPGDWGAYLANSEMSASELKRWKQSGFGASVFVKGTTLSKQHEVVISYEGSTPLKFSSEVIRDWIATDAVAQLGKDPKQYNHAVAFARFILRKYPNARVKVVGHSLGGALASHVGNQLDLETITINAPRNLNSVRKNIFRKTKQLNIVTKGDLVSDPSRFISKGYPTLPGKKIFVKPLKKYQNSPHTIDSIIDLLQ